MLIDLLIIFIVLTILFLILSIFLMESENPLLATPFIIMGWIFSVLCTYGVWNIEYIYTAVNTTTGGTDIETYSLSYGDPYSYIFYFIFFVFVVIFIRVGFNQVKIAAKKELEE